MPISTDSTYTARMSKYTVISLLLRPSTIAIHYDSDMLGQQLFIYTVFLHWEKLNFLISLIKIFLMSIFTRRAYLPEIE